jgi:hypothetical protein
LSNNRTLRLCSARHGALSNTLASIRIRRPGSGGARSKVSLLDPSKKTEAKKFTFEQQDEEKVGGADRDRTDDPLLAKQVLSQLSYSPLIPIRDGGPG